MSGDVIILEEAAVKKLLHPIQSPNVNVRVPLVSQYCDPGLISEVIVPLLRCCITDRHLAHTTIKGRILTLRRHLLAVCKVLV